ncbi:MAG: hypothetical protein JWN86_1098 [Planctomycetota bacterium]|nr:hypothetical protein [Planctomycetota bacterium]
MTDPSRYLPWPKTSHWSEIAAACRPNAADRRRAFEAICENFRGPVYSYLRREGRGYDEAQDLAQEFFLYLLDESQPLAGYDRDQSRFRTFLLGVLRHFLKGRRRYEGARKRGGGQSFVSMDAGPPGLADIAGAGPTPEVEYTRAWAGTLLDGVIATLREEEARSPRRTPIEPLLARLIEGKSASYDDMAEELGMTAGSLRVAALRLRKRFEQLLRRDIARTVPRADDVEDEIRELFAAYASPERSAP